MMNQYFYKIYCTTTSIVFHVTIRKVIEYCRHMHSYVVCIKDNCEQYLISQDKLMDEYPYGLYTSPNPSADKFKKYVVSKNITV